MMTRAYQEIYLNSAQAVLGEAFDYAINVCHITGPDFIQLFTASWKTENRHCLPEKAELRL